MEEAKCYTCLGISTQAALELALLNRIASAGSASSGEIFMNIISPAASQPADATTYFLGGDVAAAATSWASLITFADGSFPVPVACRITRVFIKVKVRTVLGTNELVTLSVRVNDTTDYAIGTMAWNGASAELSNVAMSINLNAGDTIALKIVTPTWVTNPTGVSVFGYFYATGIPI